MIKELNKIFDEILSYAERNQKCLRKAVGCAAITIVDNLPIVIGMVHNGPSRSDHECINEVGNCGCSHSEPRLVQQMIELNEPDMPKILVCTYSPCTNCANIIIDSGLFSGVIYDVLTLHDERGLDFLCDAMPVYNRNEFNLMDESKASDKIKKWISC